MNKQIKVMASLLLATVLAGSCKKDDSVSTPHRWVKTYSSVTLGDDDNTTDGQFLNTTNGQVVKLADAASVRSKLSLLYYVTYGGNAYLTSTANLASEDAYYGSSKGLMYTTPNAGLDYWSSSEKNSVEVQYANMPGTEFDQVAAATDWNSFDNAFRKYNDGDADLSFTLNSALNPKPGDVYLMELNGSLRCMAEVITASPSPTGGFIRLKIVIEGRADISSAGRPLMPAE